MAFGNSFQTLEANLLSVIGTSVPIVGTALANFAPVKQLFDDLANDLNPAVANPQNATALGSAVTHALGDLVEGAAAATGSGPYTVTAHIHRDVSLFQAGDPNATTTFGLGSFLSAKVTASLNVKLVFDDRLTFRVDANGAATIEPTPNSPMTFNLIATLPNFAASGTLNNLLTASAAVPSGAADPSFNITFAINPHADGTVDYTLSGNAQATLDLSLSFGEKAPINPKIDATLHVAWSDNAQDSNPLGQFDDLSLTHIGLDVGDLLPSFITSIVGEVQKYTKPLQPIADFLSAKIPGLSDVGLDFSLRSLADLDGEPGIGDAVDLINFLNHLPAAGQGSGGRIEFSSGLQFKGDSLSGVLDHSTALASSRSGALDKASDLLDKANSMTEDPASNQGFFSGTGETDDDADADAATDGADDSGGGVGGSKSFGFAFPIVTDPIHGVLAMLSGKDADLVTFHASASASLHGTVGAQFGPFGVFLTGGLDVALNLSLGYDTHGLREAAQGGGVDSLLDGLYFDNTATNITFNGSIGVGALGAGRRHRGGPDGHRLLDPSARPGRRDRQDQDAHHQVAERPVSGAPLRRQRQRQRGPERRGRLLLRPHPRRGPEHPARQRQGHRLHHGHLPAIRPTNDVGRRWHDLHHRIERRPEHPRLYDEEFDESRDRPHRRGRLLHHHELHDHRRLR